MVTGPVSMPFIGLVVRDWAYSAQATVMGARRVTSPQRIGGRTQREP